eukprot:s28_g31.t1
MYVLEDFECTSALCSVCIASKRVSLLSSLTSLLTFLSSFVQPAGLKFKGTRSLSNEDSRPGIRKTDENCSFAWPLNSGLAG